MEQILELQVRTIYGTDRIYPMNTLATKVAELIGRKTLNKEDVAKLKEIGFQIKWTPVTL